MPHTNEQIALLQSAINKIDKNAIPHDISETEDIGWVAIHNDDLVDPVHFRNDYYDLDNVWYRLQYGFKESLQKKTFPWYQLPAYVWDVLTSGRTDDTPPDAIVHGNAINWSEHAAHIALWSHGVTQAVRNVIDSELHKAQRSNAYTINPEIINLSQTILEKKVWAQDTPLHNNKVSIRRQLRKFTGKNKTVFKMRLEYVDNLSGIDIPRALRTLIVREISGRSDKENLRLLKRLEENAKNSLKTQRVENDPLQKELWEKRLVTTRVFIASIKLFPL